ncbi:Hemolysin, contains CBS domains [Desulfatibacillum alkenivorans DSM 16219]|uniref:Hemolysin, contains CBS domains n=2 Tax=Desulfatibacillum alkenivorans TaxID=259354 RepID=A0A1M6YQA4_9BACT|nr:Hemolysin, contains CBS domains [Desulfatibacillum alkenivorans DSM 16219]
MSGVKKPRIIFNALLFFVLIVIGGAAFAMGIVDPAPADVQASQSDVALLVLYVLLALVFSFMCSVAEAVLLSVTPSFIAGLEEKAPKRAALLKKLKQEDVDRSLAAILTLNTIAHTVGAIGSGAKATAVFGSGWFGVFSAVMTLMILFFSEIIPKTLGAVYWRSLSGLTAKFVSALIFCLYPLILISEQLTKVIARNADIHVFSREEFIAMAGMGEESGHINERESRIIRNLFRLEFLKAEDIMTPRMVISALPNRLTIAQALERCGDAPFSRLPVYGESVDDITGFVLKDDLLLAMAKGQVDVSLESLKREMPVVAKDAPLSNLLELFLDKRQHIALVAGTYGGTKGLVTLEDVVETLLGMEIMDEMDEVKDMQALARKQWSKRAEAMGLDVDAAGKASDKMDADQQSQNRED